MTITPTMLVAAMLLSFLCGAAFGVWVIYVSAQHAIRRTERMR